MIWGYPYFWKHPYICIYIYIFFFYILVYVKSWFNLCDTYRYGWCQVWNAGINYQVQAYNKITHLICIFMYTYACIIICIYTYIHYIYIYLYIIYIWILYRHSRSLPRPGRDWMKGQNFEVKCVNKKLSWLETELTNLPIVDTAGLLRRWVLCLEELKARAPCMDDSFEQRSFSTTTEQTF